jgi:hypothetical protein
VDNRPGDAMSTLPTVTLIPTATGMLRELRHELAATLGVVAGIPAAQPVRTYQQGDHEVRIWHDGPTLRVLTSQPRDGYGSLHIASKTREPRSGWPVIETLPDWTCIRADEALDIAGALLGAVTAIARGDDDGSGATR